MIDTLLPAKDRTLFDYWLIIYDRRYSIVLVTLSAVMLALGLSKVMPPVYEASSVFYVPAPMSQPLLEKGTVPPFPSGLQDEAKAYVKILKGNSIQARIREKLPEVNPDIFGRGVDFSASREGIITIYVRNRNPEIAANVANEYIKAFDKFSEENARAQIFGSLSAVEVQIEEFESKLDEITAERRKFRELNSVVAPENEMGELVRQRQNAERDLEKAQILLASVDSQLRKGVTSSGVEIAIESGVTNEVLESLRKTLAQLQIEIAGKKVQFQDDHPFVSSLQSQYLQAQEEMRLELLRIKRESEQRVENLEALVATLSQGLRERPGVIARADLLDEGVKRYSDLLGASLKQREELKIEGVKGYGGAVVVETAMPPGSPVFPNVRMNVFMALILGLLGGILYAFFLDYLETIRRVRRLREFEMDQLIAVKKLEGGRPDEHAMVER